MTQGNPVGYNMTGDSVEARVSFPLVYTDGNTIGEIVSEKVDKIRIEEAWVSNHLTVYGRFPSVVVLAFENIRVMTLVERGSVKNHGNAVWSFTVSPIPAYHVT